MSRMGVIDYNAINLRLSSGGHLVELISLGVLRGTLECPWRFYLRGRKIFHITICITLNLVVTEKISIIEKVHQYQCITILTVLEVVEESKLGK
jgi:hypothetical protein